MLDKIVSQTQLDTLLVYLKSQGRVRQTEDGIDVFMSAQEMADYFNVTRQAVNRLVGNYKKEDPDGFRELCKELLPKSGTGRPITIYNLDIIIYVGYRVHSTERARLFREYVANAFKNHIASRLVILQKEVASLKRKTEDQDQVMYWLGMKQGAGKFLTDSLPNGDRD